MKLKPIPKNLNALRIFAVQSTFFQASHLLREIIISENMKDVNTTLEEDWERKAGGAKRSLGDLAIVALPSAGDRHPRRLSLSRPVTPDEHLWLARSANFYMALAKGDLASTYQSEHPGVTVMWAGTAGFLTRYPQYRTSGPDQADSNEFQPLHTQCRDVSPLDLLVAGSFS